MYKLPAASMTIACGPLPVVARIVDVADAGPTNTAAHSALNATTTRRMARHRLGPSIKPSRIAPDSSPHGSRQRPNTRSGRAESVTTSRTSLRATFQQRSASGVPEESQPRTPRRSIASSAFGNAPTRVARILERRTSSRRAGAPTGPKKVAEVHGAGRPRTCHPLPWMRRRRALPRDTAVFPTQSVSRREPYGLPLRVWWFHHTRPQSTAVPETVGLHPP